MLLIIGGPTASSKSKVAITLAKLYHLPIICGDAFQIYKEMNIGTNKGLDQLEGVEYYLLDKFAPDEPVDVFKYQTLFRETVNDLQKKYPFIIVVGGTGLYIRAAIMDYSFTEFSYTHLDYSSYTNEQLFDKLKDIDMVEANKLHPNNRRRVERALDIYYQTGKSKSEIFLNQNKLPLYENIVVSLDLDREVLYKKINDRVDKMWNEGLKEEVINLVNKYGENQRAFEAIGYKEVIDGIKHNFDDESIKENIKQNTRRYAKRQMTFFKHQFDTLFFTSIDEEVAYLKGVIDGKNI